MFIAPQPGTAQAAAITDGLSLALALLAAGAAPASAAPASAAPAAVAAAGDRCASLPPSDNPNAIVVCAPRQEGYRLDPDIMKAKRLARTSRPPPPERLRDTSCKVVRPMGCGPPAGINLVAAGITAATMIGKAVRGENVGEMFITDPQPDEYQIYAALKREREAEAADKAAKLKAKAAEAAAAAAKAGEPSRE